MPTNPGSTVSGLKSFGRGMARTLPAAALLGVALLLATAPAMAQQRRNGLNGAPRGGAGRGGSSAPATASTGAPQEVWPRLDAGAFLCATQEDLRRHATEMADPGASSQIGRADCRLVQKMTPITILNRAGPGATEVRVTGPNGPTGWTNTWLPEKGTVTARVATPAAR